MQFLSNIEIPASWNSTFTGTVEEVVFETNKLSKAITNMYMSYCVDQKYSDLERGEKMRANDAYKWVLELVNYGQEEYMASGAILSLQADNALLDQFTCFADCVKNLKLLDDIFFSFMSEDAGNDLNLDGYLNTTAVKTKEMLFDLFVEFMNFNRILADHAPAE